MGNMKLLHYNSTFQESPPNDAPFSEAFPSGLPCWEFFTFSSIEKLVDTLKKPGISFESIVLLYIRDEGEVNAILEQQSLFREVDTMIILSITTRSLSAKCFRICPRMVFRGEPSPITLFSVLMKKAQHLLQRHPTTLRNCSDPDRDEKIDTWENRQHQGKKIKKIIETKRT